MRARRAWIVYCRALRGHCSQCGQRWSDRACGPTHAAIAAARRQLPRRPPRPLQAARNT